MVNVGWLVIFGSYQHVQYSSSSCKGASGVLQITGSNTVIFVVLEA